MRHSVKMPGAKKQLAHELTCEKDLTRARNLLDCPPSGSARAGPEQTHSLRLTESLSGRAILLTACDHTTRVRRAYQIGTG